MITCASWHFEPFSLKPLACSHFTLSCLSLGPLVTLHDELLYAAGNGVGCMAMLTLKALELSH